MWCSVQASTTRKAAPGGGCWPTSWPTWYSNIPRHTDLPWPCRLHTARRLLKKAPALGGDNAAVYGEIGLGPAEIARLADDGVV
jgi:hypothetical protein